MANGDSDMLSFVEFVPRVKKFENRWCIQMNGGELLDTFV